MRDVEGTLRFTSRERRRKWLEKNHGTKIAALLVVYKRPPKNENFHLAMLAARAWKLC